MRALREELEFEPGEAAEHSIIRRDDGGLTWPLAVEELRWKYEVSDTLLGIIRRQLASLSQQKMLSLDHLAVYERFAIEGEKE